MDGIAAIGEDVDKLAMGVLKYTIVEPIPGMVIGRCPKDGTPKIRAETWGKENRSIESHEEGRHGEMKEITPEESRTRRVKTYLQDLLEAARSAHEETAVLHHTSYSLTELDTLKLHTNLIRAQAERMTSLINDLIANIEKGEIVMEDFSPK